MAGPTATLNMPLALKECVDNLIKKGVIVIGIGVETDQMGKFLPFAFFSLHAERLD